MVDIQGVGNVLTDPLIHCLDSHRFDSGNFGYEGILKFFMSHKCNKYCKDLNLIHPN
jgi:elongation factor 2 kinase